VAGDKRSAIGFVMTIYRRRLASSFLALRKTLEGHLEAIGKPGAPNLLSGLTEGAEDDDGDEPEEDAAAKLAQEGLAMEERSEIERLIAMIRRLPAADTKCGRLREELAALRADGYQQAMVFTQFTDTMDFLRTELSRAGESRIMCFSGRGGEVANNDGTWRVISRDDVKRRFRDGAADVLLCTDAAAEGLNFQFCGALINYDMPWNPMRVEQRIGRIDRLGQKYPDIRIVNLHYADTVETDVYVALRHRIGLFEKVVGSLQPILARMPGIITGRVLTGQGRGEEARRAAVREIEAEASRTKRDGGFDIDAVTDDADLTEPPRLQSALTMEDLERVIASPPLLPPGLEVTLMGQREYSFREPGFRAAVRVTTDPVYYEQNADSLELWSPCNPTLPGAGERGRHPARHLIGGSAGIQASDSPVRLNRACGRVTACRSARDPARLAAKRGRARPARRTPQRHQQLAKDPEAAHPRGTRHPATGQPLPARSGEVPSGRRGGRGRCTERHDGNG
jgi:hypothetical protein